MPKKKGLSEVLPKAGLVYSEKGNLSEVMCKPRILPLKSITLQKIEQMEKEAATIAEKLHALHTEGPSILAGKPSAPRKQKLRMRGDKDALPDPAALGVGIGEAGGN